MTAGLRQRWWWVIVIAITLAGLGLRMLSAHGGLWTDEAWSVIYAAQARDPIGVFFRINHDNNHHLNSLWLQAIGIRASPLLARLPAILTGSLCIVAAALLAGRRSAIAGIIAAILFAFSPALVVFGSEARGYAPMLLAGLVTLYFVAEELDGRSRNGARWLLAGVAILGMFSHLTMAAPVAIAIVWFYLERRDTVGPDAALKETVRLMGPALAATVAVILFVFGAAVLSPTGLRLGGYTPFSLSDFVSALDNLALWSAGISSPLPWLIPLLIGAAALLIMVKRPVWLGPRARLYALLILAIPLGAAIIRPGNTGFARYYLTSSIGILLFLSEWIARGLGEKRLPIRATAMVLLAALVGISFYGNSLAIDLERGRPAAAVADMATFAPSGARVSLAQQRLQAVVEVAAAERNYPLHFESGCAPAEFLLSVQNPTDSAPSHVVHCGIAMEAVDSSKTIALTGDSWVLYRARNLQRREVADSGPAQGAGNRRLFAERA